MDNKRKQSKFHPILNSTLQKSGVTFIKFVKNPRTDITINIPMNIKDMYCTIDKEKIDITII